MGLYIYHKLVLALSEGLSDSTGKLLLVPYFLYSPLHPFQSPKTFSSFVIKSSLIELAD